MDEIDRQIAGFLREDGRATYAEIGEHVCLSAPAVKRRVDKLIATGAIKGFAAMLDPDALGWTMEAYVEVYCKGIVTADALRIGFSQIPEVVSACTISGRMDAVVRVLAADITQLEHAVGRIRTISGVDRTNTAIVLSRLIDKHH